MPIGNITKWVHKAAGNAGFPSTLKARLNLPRKHNLSIGLPRVFLRRLHACAQALGFQAGKSCFSLQHRMKSCTILVSRPPHTHTQPSSQRSLCALQHPPGTPLLHSGTFNPCRSALIKCALCSLFQLWERWPTLFHVCLQRDSGERKILSLRQFQMGKLYQFSITPDTMQGKSGEAGGAL